MTQHPGEAFVSPTLTGDKASRSQKREGASGGGQKGGCPGLGGPS